MSMPLDPEYRKERIARALDQVKLGPGILARCVFSGWIRLARGAESGGVVGVIAKRRCPGLAAPANRGAKHGFTLNV